MAIGILLISSSGWWPKDGGRVVLPTLQHINDVTIFLVRPGADDGRILALFYLLVIDVLMVGSLVGLQSSKEEEGGVVVAMVSWGVM